MELVYFPPWKKSRNKTSNFSIPRLLGFLEKEKLRLMPENPNLTKILKGYLKVRQEPQKWDGAVGSKNWRFEER